MASPAFKFISKERFDSVKYADNIVEETKQVIAAHRASVLKGIDIILPRLKDGWVTQRGDIYQFGPSPSQEEPNRIDLMNPTKLANAPINNMAPERQVGFVQYELKIRGAKQLNAASSAQVKGKSIKLTEGKDVPKECKKMARPGGAMMMVFEDWEKKQLELQRKGMGQKEDENLATEKKRVADLAFLNSVGGPFTNENDVEEYVKSERSESEKNKRLYVEIRFARDSTISFPKNSDIFRLKKAYKNLPTETYAINLKTYFKKVHCHVDMSMSDFITALDTLSN